MDVVEHGEFGAASRIRLDERSEFELAGVQGFKLVVDAEMVAAEGAGTDDRDARYALERGQGLLLCGGGGRFHGLAAAGVELEKLGDLVFSLGGARRPEACRCTAGAADVRVRRDELEQVESDVFRAASRVDAGFHGCLSRMFLKRW